jgi:hypothetical protein
MPGSDLTISRIDNRQPAPAGSSRRRNITIADERFPLGRAQVLAWNVVLQGQQDLSTWLCRDGNNTYFLFCRSGNRRDLPPAIVPMSPERASVWFAAHPVHIAEWDTRPAQPIYSAGGGILSRVMSWTDDPVAE